MWCAAKTSCFWARSVDDGDGAKHSIAYGDVGRDDDDACALISVPRQIDESRLHPEKLTATSLEAVKSEERSEKKTTSRDMAGNIRSMMDFLEEF